MSLRHFPRALVVAAAMAGAATPADAQSPFSAELLRDLPSGSNVFAILETAQPEITTDRFNSGGLNGGTPDRASAFLASWSQTFYRAGDLAISNPRDGTPMLFPELAWWHHVDVRTGPMPADTAATGLAVSLAPPIAGTAWTGSFEATASGGGLAQDTPDERPAAIVKLDDWTHASALVSGPAIGGRLGLTAGAGWTDSTTTERGHAVPIEQRIASAFAQAAFAISPERAIRGLAWLQSTPTGTSMHVQSTLAHDSAARAWRIFGGYTGRSRNTGTPSIDVIDADRLIDGPIPLLFEYGDQGERRWAVGGRLTRAKGASRHELAFGGDLEYLSAAAALPFTGAVREYVDGVPTRIWSYTDPALDVHRHAWQVSAFGEDRISLTPTLRLDAAIRFDSVDASARGAERGIQWRTWLPSLRLHWDWQTPLRLQFVTGVSRAADRPLLDWLAYGDPEAPTARVFKWNDLRSGQPLIARVGPGTGGDPAFSAIDPELKRPLTDEFVLGLESSPTQTLRFSVVGLARRQTSLIHAVNIGVPISSYTMFTVPDANADLAGPADDQLLPVYNRLPESFGRDRYLLTNPELEAATMGAVVVSASLATARLTLHVGGTASASVGSGANRGFTSSENDQAIDGELFSTPNAQTYARGRLFNDRAYTIKVMSVYRAPWDIRLGAIARYQDGQPFSRLVVVPGLNQGAEAIQAFANGRSRFSYRSTLDVRVQKGFSAGPARLDLILDAYNLLNMSTEVEEYVVTGPRYRETTAVQPPRAFHLGARVTF